MTDGEIRISWLLESGELAGPVCHHISVFDGTVPMVGDVLAVELDDGIDTLRVMERYHVQPLGDECWWHIVVGPVEIPAGREAVLRVSGVRTSP
jgi:hypothetical protein